jgi:hypothetical protein
MTKPTDPIFTTKHNSAIDELGGIGSGVTWGAFNVPIDEADERGASVYVVPLWNYHRSGADGRPDPASKGLLVDPQDGTLWYQFKRPPKGEKSSLWKAQWRSLAICQRLAVPIVGVLKDRVSDLCATSFTFEGGPFIADGDDLWMRLRPRAGVAPELVARHIDEAPHLPLAAQLERLDRESVSLRANGDFDAAALVDARARVLREVVQRQGQPAFRNALLAAYGGRCAVTGCDAEDALEAAHIIGYCGPASQDVRNGLLLRADIHTLFDLDLVSICPERLQVVLAPALRTSTYAELHGRPLSLPSVLEQQPDRAALRHRWTGSVQSKASP